MCDACYRDCLRGEDKPRWVGLTKYLICKHCFICCPDQNACSCESIIEWGPTQHFDTDSDFQLWLQRPTDVITLNNDNECDVRKDDYAYMHKIITNRVCKICECNSSPIWKLGKNLLDELGPLKEDNEVLPRDWVCEGCFNSAVYPTSSGNKTHKFASAREGALEYTLKVLEELFGKMYNG